MVWFGESLPPEALAAAVDAASSCDLLLSIGTSGVVYPAAEIPQVAARLGATVIQVNPQQTPLDAICTVNLRGPAARVLPALVDAAWPTEAMASDLFEPEPPRWGLRGDPYVWRALRERLAGTELPGSVAELTRLLHASFTSLVGVDLDDDGAAPVYREEFAHGGMSSGMVSVETWRDRLMPTLIERAAARYRLPP